MQFKAIVFDFDGTLVDSAPAKYEAFFELFPDTPPHREIVSHVLHMDPDGSRHAVIPRMIEQMKQLDLALPSQTCAQDRIEAYGRLATNAVAACRELPGASELLHRLSDQCKLYVCSNTTEDALKYLINQRGWSDYIKQASGYPASKIDCIAEIIRDNGSDAQKVAVVGDGISDQEAAKTNHCPFLKVAAPVYLDGLEQRLEGNCA